MKFVYISNETDNATDCVPCNAKLTSRGRVVEDEFMTYLPMFLSDNPGESCSKGFLCVEFVHLSILIITIIYRFFIIIVTL